MAMVPNAVEIMPKIWTAWVGRTIVTDDTQTTDGRATANSERERDITIAKTYAKCYKNSSGDEIANVNVYATRIRWNNAK